MNNNTTVPTPKHGDKQTTSDGNYLVCIHEPGNQKKFFYMTPAGVYKPNPFSIRNKQFLNKSEWNWLYGKTQKVEALTETELAVAEDLFHYIRQDVTTEWDIKDVRKSMQILASQASSSGGSIRGLSNLAERFAN